MAHAGRPASRHGTYDAFRREFSSESAADELPSQSVFNYEGTEVVRPVRENPIVHRKMSSTSRTTSRGVIPSGPVVALHMFDVPSDKSDSGNSSSPTPSRVLCQWSREILDGSNKGFPPALPRPPSTPRSSQQGSMRRRSLVGQQPPNSKSQRPSSRKSSRDISLEQEDPLSRMTPLRPQTSLGKYAVLPSISPSHDRDRQGNDTDVVSIHSDEGSEDQRGKDELILGETCTRSSDNLLDRPPSHNSDVRRTSECSRSFQDTEPVAAVPKNQLHHHDSDDSCTSPKLVDRSHTSLSQYRMDEAPKPSTEGQILLGVKIPTDGSRHKQYFNPRDQLRCIVLFAEEVSGEDFSNHILVQTIPRQSFKNLSQTIEAAGLQNKTILHLEELD